MGFAVHHFLIAFNQTFYKSGYESFENFFLKNKNIKKWMVFSDYVFDNKNKQNDVVTFTIAPFPSDFNLISEHINKLSFKDIKKLKRVNDDFLEFIDKSQVFNISIILSKKRKLCYMNEKDLLITKFDMAIKQLDHWCITTPQAKNNYIKLKSKLAELIRLLNGQGVNFKAIRDIEVISSLAAYLMFEVTKVIEIDKIGWFSDRDSILSYKAAKFKSPVIYDLVSKLYYLFCTTENIDTEDKLLFGVPEENGKVWYDSFIRIPDLICATLADYDIKKNNL